MGGAVGYVRVNFLGVCTVNIGPSTTVKVVRKVERVLYALFGATGSNHCPLELPKVIRSSRPLFVAVYLILAPSPQSSD